jgi:hypothetical protein
VEVAIVELRTDSMFPYSVDGDDTFLPSVLPWFPFEVTNRSVIPPYQALVKAQWLERMPSEGKITDSTKRSMLLAFLWDTRSQSLLETLHQSENVPETSTVAVFAALCCYGDKRVGVYWSHLLRFGLPVGSILLDDAKSVYPQVAG